MVTNSKVFKCAKGSSFMENGYREFILDNGLFVAMQKTPTKTFSSSLRVFHGSANELPGEEGIAHFLEHVLVTGGTKKYSPHVAKEIVTGFGYFNARTYIDNIDLEVSSLKDDLESYLDVASEMAFSPRMNHEEIEEERARILREISDQKSNSFFKDRMDFTNALYGKSPYSQFVGGKESVIQAATSEDLFRYHQRGFSPNNSDLLLIGALPDNTEDLVKKYFGSLPKGNGKRFEFPLLGPLENRTVFHRSATDLVNKDNEQESNCLIWIGFRAPNLTQDESYPMKIAAPILGEPGRLVSRLQGRLSTQLGLGYSASASYELFLKAGSINITTSVKATKKEEAIDAIFHELKRLKTEPVSKIELAEVKKLAKFKIAGLYESNHGRGSIIIQKVDFNQNPEEFLYKTEKVTREDIIEAVNQYFPGSREDNNYVMLVRDPLKVSGK